MLSLSPSILTNRELLHYAQLQLDNNRLLPRAWQQELIKRGQAATDGLPTEPATTRTPTQLELFPPQ